jgi:hypothetical protein
MQEIGEKTHGAVQARNNARDAGYDYISDIPESDKRSPGRPRLGCVFFPVIP